MGKKLLFALLLLVSCSGPQCKYKIKSIDCGNSYIIYAPIGYSDGDTVRYNDSKWIVISVLNK